MRFLTAFLIASIATFGAAFVQAGHEIIASPATAQALQFSSAGVVLAVLALVIRVHAFKVGGLTFCRLGRLSFSFCITKN